MPDRAAVVAHNAEELVKLDGEAAGLVQGFFLECDRRGTLVQFSKAQAGGKTVEVDAVDGPEETMSVVAQLLVMTLIGRTLEV